LLGQPQSLFNGRHVVFSFFKKDSKPDAKPAASRAPARPSAAPAGSTQGAATTAPRAPATRALNAPVNRSLNRPSVGRLSGGGAFAVTENAMPDRELQRSLAMATAAKIDAIESEMTRDFLRPRKPGAEAVLAPEVLRDATPVEAAPPPPEEVSTRPLPTAAAATAPVPQMPEEDPFENSADLLAGSINAIEVSVDNSAMIDEAAILFANRQDAAAEAALQAGLAGAAPDPQTERGWLMLIELFQQRGDRAAFDRASADFAARFGASAPGWMEYEAAPAAPPAAAAGLPSVALPPQIDAGIVRPLEELKALALRHPVLILDAGATQSINLVGAELLLRVFTAFKRATHELVILGADQLMHALRDAIEPGRRDASEAAWMLLLEVQRLLDRQADFEETGIQYCITYEVSPPSWEPPLPNLRAQVALSPQSAPVADALAWRGELTGDGDTLVQRLAEAGRPGEVIAVDCRLLRRMGFATATSLVAPLGRLRQAGFQLEMRNVNSLVAALWQLLGVSAAVTVNLRRA
jgi:anti-anti-sigma regulatory factor